MNRVNDPGGAGRRGEDAAWTILKLLSRTGEYFTSHDIENPRADAEILLAHCLGLNRIDLYVQYDKPLSAEELSRYREMVRRRGRREPVAYITGEKEFWSLSLKVTPDVLIPRPETECLVEAALAALEKSVGPGHGRVLDLGTGSGAIILALAAERPNDHLVAVDRSASALAIARENAGRHDMDSRVRFLNGDWFEPLDQEKGFDLIASNPPYIRRDDIAHLQPEITAFEPVSALDGGPDGARCLVHIIHTAPKYLRASGSLLMEMGHDQAALLEAIAGQTGCYETPTVLKDYSGLDRVFHLRKKP
jgi:release factor glutamine methyltransferase